MKVIVAGSRTISSLGVVSDAVLLSGFCVTEVVSGTAGGVDSVGEKWAEKNNVPVCKFPAKWWVPGVGYDRAAGFKRNQTMADYAEALIAVWDGRSNGTRDMISRAKRKGILVFVYDTSLA